MDPTAAIWPIRRLRHRDPVTRRHDAIIDCRKVPAEALYVYVYNLVQHVRCHGPTERQLPDVDPKGNRDAVVRFDLAHTMGCDLSRKPVGIRKLPPMPDRHANLGCGRQLTIHLVSVCVGSFRSLSDNLVNVQRLLADHLGRVIVMVSITMDLESDTPGVLAEFATERSLGHPQGDAHANASDHLQDRCV